jgi:NAD(P)-dependent dehydrogenase (short-subunit alcohol dehydrogenase family)
MEIEGKVGIITGAAAGIGQATAFALADAGIEALSLADVDEAGLAETAGGIEARGAKALTARVDVTDPGQLKELFATTEAELGSIDIVFNNAGIMCGDPQWPATSLERIRTVISVNLLGVMYGTRLALDAMAKHGGVVVNTASVAAFGPMPNDPMYSATKAAVVNFTQSCAGFAESHNVRVNAVLPGVTETAILAGSGDGTTPAEWLKPLLASVVKLTPADIAAGVLELICDDSRAGAGLVVGNPAAEGEAPTFTPLPDPASFFGMAAAQAQQRAQQAGG